MSEEAHLPLLWSAVGKTASRCLMLFVFTRGVRSIRVSAEARSCVDMRVHNEKVRAIGRR